MTSSSKRCGRAGVPQGVIRTGSTTQVGSQWPSDFSSSTMLTDGARYRLEVLDDLARVEVGRELAGGVVAGVGVGQVAGEDALQPGGLEVAQAHRLAEQADLGVDAAVDQVRQPPLLADRVDVLRACRASGRSRRSSGRGACRPSRN